MQSKLRLGLTLCTLLVLSLPIQGLGADQVSSHSDPSPQPAPQPAPQSHPDPDPTATLLSCFQSTYAEAKKQFQEQAREWISKSPLHRQHTEQVGVASIDTLYLHHQEGAPLVIIQSGIHGVEGHAGSAVQCALLKILNAPQSSTEATAKTLPRPVNFLFIHGINADGFTKNRRVNHNNVDLNRNLFNDPKLYETINEGYAALDDFLNPKSPLTIGFFSKTQFYFKAIHQIVRHSVDQLKRTLLRGQYHFPKGIYYGGPGMEPQIQALTQIWDRYTASHERLLLIDLHTGYGERSRLHLLSNSSQAREAKALQELFQPTLIDFGDSRHFYESTGDNITGFLERYRSKKALGVAFEYGTMDSQTLRGSIDSLYRVIIENQGTQFGYTNASSEEQSKALFVEMFYPRSPEWRLQVLEQTQIEFKKVLERL